MLLAVYLVLAVTAFNNPKPTVSHCTKVIIDIADESTYGFLDAKEIKHILVRKNLYPMGRELKDVSIKKIEEILSASPFVNTAQCCKTNSGHVKITVTQRSPIVRVMSENGADYYIDENGGIMPNSRYTSDLIIVTGSVTRKFAQEYVSLLTKIIMGSDLWRNQIEQINVLPDLGIELVPRVGDHIVFLGYLPSSNEASQREKEVNEYVTEKLSRLEKFYRYGLSVAGWNKYSRIDVQYSNQIICKRHSDKDIVENLIKKEPVTVTEEQKKPETHSEETKPENKEEKKEPSVEVKKKDSSESKKKSSTEPKKKEPSDAKKKSSSESKKKESSDTKKKSSSESKKKDSSKDKKKKQA